MRFPDRSGQAVKQGGIVVNFDYVDLLGGWVSSDLKALWVSWTTISRRFIQIVIMDTIHRGHKLPGPARLTKIQLVNANF